MAESQGSLTILLPGIGLVECVTSTVESTDGQISFVRVEAAVDKDGRRVDERTWRRIERSLGTR